MSQPQDSEISNSPNPNLQIQQDTTGDRNQSIGQVLGGIVVNVNGGQAIFGATSSEAERSEEKKTQSAIGANPYRGLLAFQETDGDDFFGREKQIADLWEKLRSLYESTDAVRLLPIYGPSGSGKSSLARAGLIPELSRRPIPGYDKARVAVLVPGTKPLEVRVAVLVPGTKPLEALATVLARIVTDDETPVAKSREFEGELKHSNESGEFDGLRRIANVFPDIAISPLIVLVDQFEEVYTLCENQSERDTFVGNLLCAAKAQSKQVIVIVTFRSDFLGETQKHSLLNRLFTEQGYLAPAMNEAELRQAIGKPAELAGHPLDEATINLLVNDTEGREGALPLLQFALTRIWEGLAEGKPPAQTLKEIGGVGGALAGEAQRIYDKLSVEEQEIARRIFLGLVQLGEGTKDTRRRALLNSLVSYQNQPEQLKRVVNLFSAPGVRLITLSATGSDETAEVTHEALFEHWRKFQEWLDGSRDDIRFQRRLDENARYWDEKGRPEGNLWRPPDLDLLKNYQQRCSKDMTPLQMEFFTASRDAEESRKEKEQEQQVFQEQAIKFQQRAIKFQKRAIWGLSIVSVGAISFAGFAFYQLQQAQRQRVEQLAATAGLSLSTQAVEATVNALAAVGLSQSPLVQFPNHSVSPSVYGAVLDSVRLLQERNRLQHQSGVNSVAFSPDGTQIVSSSEDKTLRLWDAKTLKPIGKPLLGHQGWVLSVAFSPDGTQIVSSSSDKTLRLWDAKTLKPIGQPLLGHQSEVYSVAFSPEGTQIVSGSDDKTLRLWDAKTLKPIGKPLLGHQGWVSSVAFSPDGTQIVSGSNDKTLRLWDAKTLKPIGKPLLGHQSSVSSVAFSPDGTQIVSGSRDKTLRLWDAKTLKPIGKPLLGHQSSV
ncbi:WD40 repeat domain-containing protein, partial [Microcoleus sp. T3_A4]|uniref:WD40 repeat domain-containing protein n=1 Tax=Microcoleus sp. T3_A4 TaxID=2818968 RepID=UPI002FD0CE76